MEPAGLTIGVAGLFAASLDVLDRISAVKSYHKDYRLFITKVNIERLRFFRWGQDVGLTAGRIPHKLLQDPDVRSAVTELLAGAIEFFGDSVEVEKRHGIQGSTQGFITLLQRSNNNARSETLENPSENGRVSQRSASTLRRVRWAFSGRKKSEKLLQELGWFVDKLHEIVPPSGTHEVITLAEDLEQLPLKTSGTKGDQRWESRPRTDNRTQRRKKKHARRIAAAITADRERIIRIDER